MKGFRNKLHAASLFALFLLIALPLSYQFRPGAASPLATKVGAGPEIFTIAQAAEVWPKIVEATIDPLDVHVGDRQVIEAVIESREPVTEVYADIQTDRKVLRLQLAYVGVAEAAGPSPFAGIVEGIGEPSGLQIAHAQETTRGRYRGEWTVHDTHDTTYHTTIVARAGEDESSVVLAWTDACGIPVGGAVTISSPCTLTSNDGADNGNASITNTLTLTNNSGFAVNDGFSISISGSGSIALCSGCTIQQTNIWVDDADADGYGTSAMALQATAPGVDSIRRYTATGINDCYDGSSDVRPSQTAFFDTPYDMGGPTSWDYNCDGSEEFYYSSVQEVNCVEGEQKETCIADPEGWMQAPSCGEIPYADACYWDGDSSSCLPQFVQNYSNSCR